MSERVNTDWKWGFMVALAMTILALYPQLHLLVQRGRSWAGAYAYVDTDEVAYSAYLQALIDGHPRRNDPYTGRDELAGKPLPESLFSIQFVPPYILAIPARILGLSSSSVFITLMPVVAASTALTLFWLLTITTEDSRLAAVGTLVVCCLSTLVSAQGVVRTLLGSAPLWSYLPFLRRYVPALLFPLFIAVFGLVWRSINAENRGYVAPAIAAGFIVILLIFGYFYLWTAAVAWLACVAAVWLIARPEGWRRCISSISITAAVSLCGLIPYLMLLSHRAAGTDQLQVLLSTRSLDLLRPSELLSIGLLTALAVLSFLKRLAWRDRDVLFLGSLLLMPLVVFNQQIITGRSLQPFHYEEFVTSYCVLIAIVIAWRLFLRAKVIPQWTMSHRALFWVSIFSLVYGANSASAISRAALGDNLIRDKSVAVGNRLRQLGKGNGGVLLPIDLRQAEAIPTIARQPVLWAVHMSVFSGSHPAEIRERFYQYLYYSGASVSDLNHLLIEKKNHVIFVALFGYERENATFARDFRPVSTQEINEEVQLYDDYAKSFDRQTAGKYLLSYLIVPAEDKFDVSNVDRWYERDQGEQVEDFIIYRLRLR